ncbi:hypothetical protein FRC06_006239, partial [Ceratobasidium sp. 370]
MTGLPAFELKVVAGVSLALLAVYWWLRPKPFSDIPHNLVTGILGDIPELKRFMKENNARYLDYFAHLAERHGPITQVCLGGKTILLLSDREEVERIVVRGKNVDTLPYLHAAFASIIPNSQILIPANDMWKRHRRIMGPSMHRRYLSRMTQHIAAAANALVSLWDSKLDLARGESFSAGFDLRLATTESISAILTGTSVGCLGGMRSSMKITSSAEPGVVDFSHGDQLPICQAFTMMIAATNFGIQLPLPKLTMPIVLWLYPSWRKACSSVRSYLHDALDSSRKREGLVADQESLLTDADCVVDMIVQQERREGVDQFNMDEVLDELCVYVLAGQDTTTATLSWLVKYMPQDIDIQRRLHEEVCETFGTNLADTVSITLEALDDVERMPILEAVTVETLRCALVAGVFGHHWTDMIILAGSMGTSESEWGPDAKRWRPSRWLRPDGSFNRNAGYTGDPFGSGHRACFGQRLAVTQLKVFIAAMSRAFVFKSVAPGADSWTPGTEI